MFICDHLIASENAAIQGRTPHEKPPRVGGFEKTEA
mgnify:CR=1 FL=1